MSKGQPLERVLTAKNLINAIFFGPPGCGKTSLARLMAKNHGTDCVEISCAISGVAKIRQAIDAAELKVKTTRRPTLLVLDEIHHLNRTQQDLLLPHMESGVIREFLADVAWGELDTLLFDLPPGAAADKPPAIVGLVPDLHGAVVVTTPSAVAIDVVRRSIIYARDLGIRILGIVENMGSAACPRCGGPVELSEGAALALAEEAGVPLLARVPRDPELARSLDTGVPLAYGHPISRVFLDLAERLSAP